MDYFDALRNRASIRAFSEKELSMQDLGDVLGAYREIWTRLQKHFNI